MSRANCSPLRRRPVSVCCAPVIRRFLLLLLCTAAALHGNTPVAIDIDLTEQKAYLLLEGRAVYETPISSGRASYPTPTGTFSVTEKDLDHYSSLYGRIVDEEGDTIVADADSDMPVPPGGRFVPAPMKYFIRFNGAVGMHAGVLPGYPASHGCVRLPKSKAVLFFNTVEIGSTVRVYGRAPRRVVRNEPPLVARDIPLTPESMLRPKRQWRFPWFQRR
jgi:hypothetical protein